MKIIGLFVLFAYSVVARVIDETCDGVIVHNIYHNKEIIKEDINSAYQLAIDYDKNTLFFSYSKADVGSMFNSAYINLKTNEYKEIEGINGGFANAVDGQTKTVYLGGSDGIYKFDYETCRATHIDGVNDNTWQIFIKKNIYYTTYPDEYVYVYKNSQSERVPEMLETKAMLVALDNNDNIYFSNSSGLFVHKKVKNYVIFLGDYNLNSITNDVNGNLFFSTPEGVYFIDDKSEQVKKLVSIDNIYGVVVEKDGNIIYASENSIVRLKPSKTNCIVNEKHSVNVI